MEGNCNGSFAEAKNKYQYNGKELNEDFGLNWNDYGRRFYDAAIGRFSVVDRFSQKFNNLSPYSYAANNPILYIDVNGDSIHVDEKYRETFGKALSSVFGSNAKNFSYSSSGKLLFNGDKKGFSKGEKKVFDKLAKIMGEKTTTNVIYEKSTEVTNKEGKKGTIDASKGGGEVTATIADNPNFTENYIVIDPTEVAKSTVFEVLPSYYNDGPPDGKTKRFEENEISTSVENRTWHGVGHVIHAGKTQDNVIDFDNSTRAINKSQNSDGTFSPNPLPNRKYDETHNRKVKNTNY